MSQNKRFELPAKEITPEDVYMNRRQFLRGLGTASAGTMGLISGCNSETIASRDLGGTLVNLKVLKPERNQIYTLDRPMTEEREAAKYTNFYEFSSGKNELAFIATGIYGHELPKQHGAPIRLVTPWKYGFKSIKSIVLIDFTDKRPATFWSMASREYGFWANVNPDVPHRRWSQKTERMLGTDERRPTVIYNGYGEYVSSLYRSPEGAPPGKEFFF